MHRVCSRWSKKRVEETIQKRMLAMPLRCGGILSPFKRPFKLSTNPTLRCHCSALQEWRNTPINENRSWGPTGPQPSDVRPPPFSGDDSTTASSSSSLADYAALILSAPDPLLKSRISHIAFSRWRNHFLPVGTVLPPDHPARPARPVLVPPKEIPTHKSLGLPLNVYLLHNLAHVELNAIDLAWDTVARFSPLHDFLGDVFFSDFARVADDESRHFTWCSQRLTELGFSYGDMPAHNFLWRECNKSSGDVAARLAVIPLVQGYSVELKGPFNYVARDKAGMPRDWYDDDSLIRDGIMRKLSEVHERLESIISMEQESSKLG